jgi:hypothetical protein
MYKREVLLSMSLFLECISFGEYFFLSFGGLARKKIEQVQAFVDLDVTVLVVLFRSDALER